VHLPGLHPKDTEGGLLKLTFPINVLSVAITPFKGHLLSNEGLIKYAPQLILCPLNPSAFFANSIPRR
jgi:hypothetical protein